jgi:hypothetical protein
LLVKSIQRRGTYSGAEEKMSIFIFDFARILDFNPPGSHVVIV